jgi:hypothetical protein
VTDTELAYFAGFIDGEGCITNTNTSAYMKVAHTYLPVLQKLQEVFGGSLSDHIDKSHKKKAWLWRVCGDEALQTLLALRPYLIEKQRQADIAIELLNLRTGRGRKPTAEVALKKIELTEELKLCKTY